MRKLTFVLIFVAILAAFMPLGAQAQGVVSFDAVTVQFWPEYDRPSMLVLYDFRVAASTTLPAQVTIRIPAAAQVLAVAREAAGGLVTVDYAPPTVQGEWQLISFTVVDAALHRVEYYDTLTRQGLTRSYDYLWPGDYAVGGLNVFVQQPVSATKLTATPELADFSPGADGFMYRSGTLGALTAGQEYRLAMSYEKSDDTLSASTLNVQSGGSPEQPVAGQNTFSTYLPWMVGAFGALLILGGVIWFWQTGQSGNPGGASRRRRHITHRAEDDYDDDQQIYCPQCGKRATANDKFCRACGSRIRRGES